MSNLLKKNPSDSLIYHERSLFWHERPEQSLTVAHLSWVIWANPSQSLIWSEQSDQMSDEQMSDEQMSDEQMNEFPTLLMIQWTVALTVEPSRH